MLSAPPGTISSGGSPPWIAASTLSYSTFCTSSSSSPSDFAPSVSSLVNSPVVSPQSTIQTRIFWPPPDCAGSAIVVGSAAALVGSATGAGALVGAAIWPAALVGCSAAGGGLPPQAASNRDTTVIRANKVL